MNAWRNGGQQPTMLVVELEGAADVAATAASFGWHPVFVDTGVYDEWLTKPSPGLVPDVIREPTASFPRLIDLARERGARSILPISLLEPECMRDGLLRDYADATHARLRIVANRPSIVELAYDKWLTKLALAGGEFDVIPGRPLSSAADLCAAAEDFGFPLVCKARHGFTGRGFRIFETPAELAGFARSRSVRDLIAEPFVAGAELTVEVVRGPNAYATQPIVYKGDTRVSSIEHPIYRPRVAPWRDGSADAQRVARVAVAIATELHLEGVSEMEFIFAAGRPYLLEVNPRLSGTTRLAMAAGGSNTFALLTHLAADEPWPAVPPRHDATTVAVALPIVVPTTDARVVEAARAESVCHVKPIDWMPLLAVRGSIVLRAESTGEMANLIDGLASISNPGYVRDAHAALECCARPSPLSRRPLGVYA